MQVQIASQLTKDIIFSLITRFCHFFSATDFPDIQVSIHIVSLGTDPLSKKNSLAIFLSTQALKN